MFSLACVFLLTGCVSSHDYHNVSVQKNDSLPKTAQAAPSIYHAGFKPVDIPKHDIFALSESQIADFKGFLAEQADNQKRFESKLYALKSM